MMTFQLSTLFTRLAVAAMLLAGAMNISPAWAIDLDQARSQGLVGERPDGLVGVVPEAVPPDVLAMVNSINAARLDSYKQVAEKNRTPLDAVQAIAGDKQVQKAKENKWYYMDPQGSWRK